MSRTPDPPSPRTPSEEDLLDAALDALAARADPAQAPGPGDADLGPLLDAASQAMRAMAVRPSPETRAAHVRALTEEARRLGPTPAPAPTPAPVPSPAKPERKRGRHRLRWRLAVAGSVVAVLAAGGTATAALAANAQPGQLLYSTRLAVEDVKVALQRNPGKQVTLHLRYAQERLAEAAQLVGQGHPERAGAVLARVRTQEGDAMAVFERLAGQSKVGGKVGGKVTSALDAQVLATLRHAMGTLDGLRGEADCALRPRRSPCVALLRTATATNQAIAQAAAAANVTK